MAPAVAEAVMDDRLGEQRQMPVRPADKKRNGDEKEEEIKALTEVTAIAPSSLSPRYH